MCFGKGEMRLPKQDYPELRTLYNHLGSLPDHAFFNKTIKDSPKNTDICGFAAPDYRYSEPSSIREIVDLFNIDDDIHAVVCDSLIKNQQTGSEFIEYGHSEDIRNIPFFVRRDLLHHIEFEDSPEMFKLCLRSLVRNGKKIYHIADPLLTKALVNA